MDALDILMQLRTMGITLVAQGESIRAEPKAAITDEARSLIRAYKAELLVALTQPKLEAIAQDSDEFCSERAAIFEYDAGMSREDAEAAAHEATEQHRRRALCTPTTAR